MTAGGWAGHPPVRVITAHALARAPRTDTAKSEDNMTAASTRRLPVEDIGDVGVTVSDRGDGHPVVPRSAESQVFVTQGTGITLLLTIARSHDIVKATLLQVGTPHFFD